MQMTPKSSCIHRLLRNLAAGSVAMVDAVTTSSAYPKLCVIRPTSVGPCDPLLRLLARNEQRIRLRPMVSAPEVLAQFSHCCFGCEQVLPRLRAHSPTQGGALELLLGVLVLIRAKLRCALVRVKELHPHDLAVELANAPSDKIFPERRERGVEDHGDKPAARNQVPAGRDKEGYELFDRGSVVENHYGHSRVKCLRTGEGTRSGNMVLDTQVLSILVLLRLDDSLRCRIIAHDRRALCGEQTRE